MVRRDIVVVVDELSDVPDMVSRVGQPDRQRVVLQLLIEIVAPLVAGVVKDAVIVRLQSGQEADARRRAIRIRHELGPEIHPLAYQELLEIFHVPIVVEPHVVDQDVDHVRLRRRARRLRSARGAGCGREESRNRRGEFQERSAVKHVGLLRYPHGRAWSGASSWVCLLVPCPGTYSGQHGLSQQQPEQEAGPTAL